MNRFGAALVKFKKSAAPPRWFYVGKNDHFTWLLGYCRQDCKGHDTKDQAIEHFKEWLLSEQTQYNGRHFRAMPCESCQQDTEMFAFNSYMGWEFYLCPEHLNKESIQPLMGSLESFYR